MVSTNVIVQNAGAPPEVNLRLSLKHLANKSKYFILCWAPAEQSANGVRILAGNGRGSYYNAILANLSSVCTK